MDGRLLGKEEIRPVEREIAVHLVRGDLVVAADAVFAAGVHQYGGADDVGLQEDGGVFDGAVHMALRREVHNDIGVLLLKKRVHGLPVADIRLHKAEAGIIHNGRERREIARVGELVDADDAVVRVPVQHVKNEV